MGKMEAEAGIGLENIEGTLIITYWSGPCLSRNVLTVNLEK